MLAASVPHPRLHLLQTPIVSHPPPSPCTQGQHGHRCSIQALSSLPACSHCSGGALSPALGVTPLVPTFRSSLSPRLLVTSTVFPGSSPLQACDTLLHVRNARHRSPAQAQPHTHSVSVILAFCSSSGFSCPRSASLPLLCPFSMARFQCPQPLLFLALSLDSLGPACDSFSGTYHFRPGVAVIL